MKIDLHVHASERSGCSSASEECQVRRAIELGLDALVFTDHGLFMPEERAKELNDKYAPFRIFRGIEIGILFRHGERDEDFLVLGVYDPRLENRKWGYKDLYKLVDDNKGYIAILHPYRYRDEIIDVGGCLPHAVELYSSKLEDGKREKRVELARKWNCHLIANSDSHETGTVGMYYNELFDTPKNEKELIKILKEGHYRISKN
ncbi:MAG: PHP-associated domain-containing protein [Nanoarchaeota archaeon]|nr:PHP-associated domain-containing protein [Nanoarchaeota archaeon]